MTAVTVPSSSRIAELDFIRGIAVGLILVLHAAAVTPGLENQKILFDFSMRLSVGMQLFFVLSGYMIAQSWSNLKKNGFSKREFYEKRIAKIVPLYIIFLHLNIALYLIQNLVRFHSNFPNGIIADNFTILNYAAHLVMAQGFIPSWQHSLLDGSWSIVAEVYFYAFAPWILDRYLTHPANVLRWLCIAIPAGILFSFLARNQVGYWGYYGFPAQLPCFLLGILVQRAKQSHPDVSLGNATLPFIALATLLAFGLFRGETFPIGLHIVYACIFAAILFATVTGNECLGRLPGAAVVTEFGRMSYAIFLAHLFLLKVSHPWVTATFTPAEWPVAFAANLFVSVAISWIVCKLVFHPIDSAFVRFQNQRIAARRTPSVMANA